MIWIGIIVGFCAGMVLATLLYTPLVDKVKTFEQRMIRDKEMIDEFVKTLHAYERQNDMLRSDLDLMQRLMPPEVYARYFDAPFNN